MRYPQIRYLRTAIFDPRQSQPGGSPIDMLVLYCQPYLIRITQRRQTAVGAENELLILSSLQCTDLSHLRAMIYSLAFTILIITLPDADALFEKFNYKAAVVNILK